MAPSGSYLIFCAMVWVIFAIFLLFFKIVYSVFNMVSDIDILMHNALGRPNQRYMTVTKLFVFVYVTSLSLTTCPDSSIQSLCGCSNIFTNIENQAKL